MAMRRSDRQSRLAYKPALLLFSALVLVLSLGSFALAEQPYDVIWTKQIGVTGDDKAYSVATSDAGEIYISGYTDDRINGFPNDYKRDLFLIKYDTAGILLWQDETGTNKEDVAYAVGVRKDSAGNFLSPADTAVRIPATWGHDEDGYEIPFPTGTYYVGAVADTANSVLENKGNNALAGNQIIVQ
jgi:hypothetical protein